MGYKWSVVWCPDDVPLWRADFYNVQKLRSCKYLETPTWFDPNRISLIAGQNWKKNQGSAKFAIYVAIVINYRECNYQLFAFPWIWGLTIVVPRWNWEAVWLALLGNLYRYRCYFRKFSFWKIGIHHLFHISLGPLINPLPSHPSHYAWVRWFVV